MTNPTFSNPSAANDPSPKPSSAPSEFTPDVIRALTPIVLASIGGVTAVLVLFFPGTIDSAKLTAGMAFAGTAITGAAALAQPGEDSSSDKQHLPQDGAAQSKP